MSSIFTDSCKKVGEAAIKNSPTILTIFGAVGVVTTAVMASKATIKAKEYGLKLPNKNENKDENLARLKDLAKVYGPAVGVGILTITCIFLSNKIHLKRTAALATAYTFTSEMAHKYQDKVIEEIGATKEKHIREKMQKDELANAKPETIVISDEEGMTLCYDAFTGRYFKSDIETIRQAVNDVNAMLLDDGFVALNEFYDRIGLPNASIGESIGWNTYYGERLDLTYSSQLTEKKVPCLVLNYNIEPKHYYSELA